MKHNDDVKAGLDELNKIRNHRDLALKIVKQYNDCAPILGFTTYDGKRILPLNRFSDKMIGRILSAVNEYLTGFHYEPSKRTIEEVRKLSTFELEIANGPV